MQWPSQAFSPEGQAQPTPWQVCPATAPQSASTQQCPDSTQPLAHSFLPSLSG